MIKKMTCTVEAKKWGNSIGVVVPANVVKEFDIHPGTAIDVDFKEKRRLDGFGILKGQNCKEFRRDPEDDRVERMIKYFDKKYGERRRQASLMHGHG